MTARTARPAHPGTPFRRGAILVGSGPGLDARAVYQTADATGYGICAVSSAIHSLKRMDAWATLHGPEPYGRRGWAVLYTPSIWKIVPEWGGRLPGLSLDNRGMRYGCSVHHVPYRLEQHARDIFRSSTPLPYRSEIRRSTFFALQWLAAAGAREIAIAGIELAFGAGGQEHAWGRLAGRWEPTNEPLRDVAKRGLEIERRAWRMDILPAADRAGLTITRIGPAGILERDVKEHPAAVKEPAHA